ncbi:hypothetical protein [Achromobacter insolitus]|uniref:hypothetical protein n=1 Tax=Achromobacter insolitus TaxID=217204 RepID=UPI00104254C5|nr:hypothetical protein [Achromobacter insolitus]
MSEATNLAAIEGFLRSRCNYRRILELDALILRKDMGAAHEDAVRGFVQKAIEEVMKNERKD